ncbi:copper chaperone PCu(A)C [Nonomuraea ferruginea]
MEAAALIDQGAYGKQSIHVPQAFILGPEPGGSIPWRGSVPVYLTMLNNGDSPPTRCSPSAPVTPRAPSWPRPCSSRWASLSRRRPPRRRSPWKASARPSEAVRRSGWTSSSPTPSTITLDVPVMPHSREYASYPAVEGAVPAPTPSPTPTEAAEEEAH